MAVYDVTMIPGDGIGPEVAEATRRVLEATGVKFNWDYRDIGMAALEKHGDLIPQETLESIRKNKIGIKGPTTTPIGEGFRSVNVGAAPGARALRQSAAGQDDQGRAEQLL